MNNKKLSKKHALVLVATMLLIASFILCIKWMFSPHKGNITVSSVSSPRVQATYADKTLDGTYITFSYSGKYLAKNQPAKDNELEIHKLKADTHYDKQIVATVSNLPDGQLNSYGNYTFRRNRTDLYDRRQLIVSGSSVDIWVKRDGTEQTVMIPQGNKVATVVFMTTSPSDDLTPEANALLSTFKWKQ